MNNSIILPGINTPITPESEKFRRAIVVRDFCGQVGTNEIEQVNQLAREKFGACGLEYLLAELVSLSRDGERYRQLRNGVGRPNEAGDLLWAAIGDQYDSSAISGDELDAAVDHAISTQANELAQLGPRS